MRRLALPLSTVALAAVAATAVADARAAERMVIRGAGFGHGVGMSQYGALGFAQNGRNYRQILGHYYTDTKLGRLEGRVVRVLLQANQSRVTFSGARQAGDRRLQPGSTYQAARYGDRVVLRSASGRKLRTFYAPLRVVAGAGEAVRLGGRAGNGVVSGRYRGALEIRPAGFGGLNAINAVGLEDYVRGVVAGESPASWPAEALKAQAVAARTYAIATTKNGGGFDHYPDTRSQVYNGVVGETRTTDAAVADTRGEVVTYRGRPVATYFFSTSGGRTENSENVFSAAEPWLRSVEDPYDKVSPRHRWTRRMTLTRADAKLGSLVKGKLRYIRVLKRGASPRIVRAEVVGSRGRTRVSGQTLKARFGLYDAWASFTVVGAKAKPVPDGGEDSDPGSGGAQASARDRRGGVVYGRILPSRRGGSVVVQRRAGTKGRTRWITEVRTHVGKRGQYRATVGRIGVYRVRYGAVTSQTVRVR